MIYLNLKTSEGVETVDECETIKEARILLKEYRISSSYYSGIYFSQRCTNEWKN